MCAPNHSVDVSGETDNYVRYASPRTLSKRKRPHKARSFQRRRLCMCPSTYRVRCVVVEAGAYKSPVVSLNVS